MVCIRISLSNSVYQFGVTRKAYNETTGRYTMDVTWYVVHTGLQEPEFCELPYETEAERRGLYTPAGRGTSACKDMNWRTWGCTVSNWALGDDILCDGGFAFSYKHYFSIHDTTLCESLASPASYATVFNTEYNIFEAMNDRRIFHTGSSPVLELGNT